ncbi:MAG: hypothetical protein AAF483_31400, partial [Planctomycetota bacterium]
MSDKSIISQIASLIPGYGGYLEQEERRKDDRVTREFLVSRLRHCKSDLDKRGKDAIGKGDLDLPAKLEPLHTQVDLAQSRLASAVEGYAGWFNDRKVDADLLGEIADLDAGLISLVDQLDSMSEDWGDETATEYAEALEQLHEQIDRRTTLLK